MRGESVEDRGDAGRGAGAALEGDELCKRRGVVVTRWATQRGRAPARLVGLEAS